MITDNLQLQKDVPHVQSNDKRHNEAAASLNKNSKHHFNKGNFMLNFLSK